MKAALFFEDNQLCHLGENIGEKAIMEGVVVGYDNRIRAKYTAKWGVQIAGMIFQTRSSTVKIKYLPHWRSI